MILLSACLLGIECRYNAEASAEIKRALELFRDGQAIPVCPEQLGGLPTPRCPCEIQGGDGLDVISGLAKVIGKDGNDYSEQFIKGAFQALKLSKDANIKEAWLKSRSPSCGIGLIYDGSFTSKTKKGDGVTAALLRQNGISLICGDAKKL